MKVDNDKKILLEIKTLKVTSAYISYHKMGFFVQISYLLAKSTHCVNYLNFFFLNFKQHDEGKLTLALLISKYLF